MLKLPAARDPHPFVERVYVRYARRKDSRPNYRLSIYVSGAHYARRYSSNLPRLIDEAEQVMLKKPFGGCTPMQAIIEKCLGEITGNRSGWQRVIAILPEHKLADHYTI